MESAAIPRCGRIKEEEEEEEEARKKEQDRQRVARLLRAMKRLGFEDTRKLPPRWSSKLNYQLLRQEILKDVDGDEEFWTIDVVIKQLNNLRNGRVCCPLQPEFDERMKAAIDELGGGDIFHENVTPESVHQKINLPFVPIYTVWFHLGFRREKELRRSRGWRLKRRAPRPLPSHPKRPYKFWKQELIATGKVTSWSSEEDEPESMDEEEEEESAFIKEYRMVKEREMKQMKHRNIIFSKAVKLLGGFDNLPNMKAEMLHKLITEELDPVDEDGFWTMAIVEGAIEGYFSSTAVPLWSSEHHNRMLKAIEELGGDLFNEDRVNPKAILELMEDMEGFMTPIRWIKEQLEELRKTFKEDPNHRLLRPIKPQKPFFIKALESNLSLALEKDQHADQ